MQEDDGSLDRLKRLIDENRLSDRRFWPELSTPTPSQPARDVAPPQQPDGIAKIILEAVDDAVMRVGGSANCYSEPADANSGAEYVAARVRSVIVAAYSRQAQGLPATAETVGEPSCWHCGVVLAYAPKLRCEDCPVECDAEGCEELGCADSTSTWTP